MEYSWKLLVHFYLFEQGKLHSDESPKSQYQDVESHTILRNITAKLEETHENN